MATVPTFPALMQKILYLLGLPRALGAITLPVCVSLVFDCWATSPNDAQNGKAWRFDHQIDQASFERGPLYHRRRTSILFFWVVNTEHGFGIPGTIKEPARLLYLI